MMVKIDVDDHNVDDDDDEVDDDDEWKLITNTSSEISLFIQCR